MRATPGRESHEIHVIARASQAGNGVLCPFRHIGCWLRYLSDFCSLAPGERAGRQTLAPPPQLVQRRSYIASFSAPISSLMLQTALEHRLNGRRLVGWS